MGNCISNINKDYFFAFEEEMKNECHFFKGTTRIGAEMCARGKIYMGIHSIKKFSNIVKLAPLQTGLRWRYIYLVRFLSTFFLRCCRKK